MDSIWGGGGLFRGDCHGAKGKITSGTTVQGTGDVNTTGNRKKKTVKRKKITAADAGGSIFVRVRAGQHNRVSKNKNRIQVAPRSRGTANTIRKVLPQKDRPGVRLRRASSTVSSSEGKYGGHEKGSSSREKGLGPKEVQPTPEDTEKTKRPRGNRCKEGTDREGRFAKKGKGTREEGGPKGGNLLHQKKRGNRRGGLFEFGSEKRCNS